MASQIFLVLIITYIIELFYYRMALSLRWKKGLKDFDDNVDSISAISEEFDYKLGANHLYK